MHWPAKKLGDVASVFNGKTPSRDEQRESGHPVLKIKDVDERGIFKGGFESFVDRALAAAYSEKAVKSGDTLILNAAHNADYVGSKQFYACGEVDGALATGEWCIVRANHDILDKQYASFFLQSSQARHEVRKLVKGIHLYPKDVARLQIPLPPLATQKHIARVLEQADQLRKQAQQMESELNQLAQSLFLEMFGDPVTNPKKWPLIHLGAQAELLAGYAFKSNEYSENSHDVKLCRGVNINPGSLDWSDGAYWPEEKLGGLEKFILSDGDIVIAMDRPWISTGFKMARITRNDLPALLLQRVMRVRGQDPVENNYLHYCLNQVSFLRHCRITETTVPHISPTDVSSFEIFNVPRAERERFYQQVSVIQKSMSALGENRLYLSNMFESLMQRAFNGELTAPERKAA